jgi:hypothetical protein
MVFRFIAPWKSTSAARTAWDKRWLLPGTHHLLHFLAPVCELVKRDDGLHPLLHRLHRGRAACGRSVGTGLPGVKRRPRLARPELLVRGVISRHVDARHNPPVAR